MFTKTLDHLAQQIAGILDHLTDEEYTRPLTVFNNCSIGRHTRHVIEFFVELEKGYGQGFVDYDKRQRNKILETNKGDAVIILQAVVSACERPDKLLQLCINHDAEHGGNAVIGTSYYRELAFAIDHTVHHMALIRIGLEHLQTVAVPAHFGVAASTQRHQLSCAQ